MDTQNSLTNNSFPSYFIEKKYLIIGHRVDNLGDIACSVKLANLIHRRFHVPKEQITVTSNAPEAVQIFNKYQFTVLSYKDALLRSEDDLLIAAPASSPDLGNFLKLGKPIICINEYEHKINPGYESFQWIHWASFGLGPNKIGILISRKLAKIGFSPHSPLAPERLKLLEQIDPILKGKLLDKKSVEDLSHSHALYISYVSNVSCKIDFIRAITQLNKNENKNLIFISPGTDKRAITPDILKEDENFFSFLSSLNISNILLYHYDYTDKKIELTFSNTTNALEGKTMTIICGSFQHQDLKKLFSYSEKEMLTTGDQSISEGISANKSWLYEPLQHKMSLTNQLDAEFNKTKGSVLTGTWQGMYETFKQRKMNQYQEMTENNRLLTARDCTSALSKLIEKALIPSSEPALIHINPDKKSLTPEDLPIKTPVVMTIPQICDLEICISSQESSLPIFQGSIFNAKVLAGTSPTSYLVIRSLK